MSELAVRAGVSCCVFTAAIGWGMADTALAGVPEIELSFKINDSQTGRRGL